MKNLQDVYKRQILKLIINTKSKITFNTEETIKKYNGVLLSPNALNILAIKLYATVAVSYTHLDVYKRQLYCYIL